MATNLIMKDGRYLSVACSDPATPASGNPVRFGAMTGVAQGAEGADVTSETTVDFGQAVYALSVKAVNASGNSAVAAGDSLFYVDADTPKLSKKNTGYFFGFALAAVESGATATINVLHVPAPGTGTIGTGEVTTTKLGANAVTAAKLTATLATGFIPLDITTVKIISSNAIGNTTEGLLPDGNTDPILQRTNGATDKALRLVWAANSAVEVQFGAVPKPPDLDDTAALTVNLMISKDTNTDTTAEVAVGVFDGIGDTNCGGNTAALASASLAKYSVSVAHGDLADYPGMLNIVLTPGTHANDAIRLHAAWLEYTRE